MTGGAEMIVIDESKVRLLRSDLERVKPGDVDGITQYGHRMGRMQRGVGYWTGTVEFARRSRRTEIRREHVAYLEAVLAELKEDGAEFHVPMFRNPQLGLVTAVANNADVDLAALTVTVGTGGVLSVPKVNGHSVVVTVLPGARITIGDELHLCKASAGMQTITTTKPETIPEWPAASTSEVELLKPTVAGVVLPESSLPLNRRGSWGGPYAIPWIAARMS